MPESESKIISVSKTATCEINLFWFFTPFEQTSKIKPNRTGINAVGEDDSVNPHKPMVINVTEFIKLAIYEFMSLFNYY